MRRADRLFSLLQEMRSGRLVTADQLALRLEVSSRTVYRDIADLQANGVPIDGERGVGYVLRGGYFMPPLALTALEFEALQFGVAFVSAHGDDALSEAARQLQIKLQASLTAMPHIASQIRAFGKNSGARHKTTLKIVRESVSARRKSRITYADAVGNQTTRVIWPLELAHWGEVWTLAAWCELRDGFRSFRIDRIAAITPLEARFRPEKGRRIEDYHALLMESKPGPSAPE